MPKKRSIFAIILTVVVAIVCVRLIKNYRVVFKKVREIGEECLFI